MEESKEGGCFKTIQLLCLEFMENTVYWLSKTKDGGEDVRGKLYI